MPAPDIVTRTLRLAAGQRLMIHLTSGVVVRVSAGRIALHTAPRWLAGGIFTVGSELDGEGVQVIEEAGWYRIEAHSAAQLQIMALPPRPSLWRLIKSRLGRSGLLLGNARPPDDKAAEQSVPHATSQ